MTDRAQALLENGRLKDILVTRSGRTLYMLGPAGPEREERLLREVRLFPDDFPASGLTSDPASEQAAPGPSTQDRLPVLIGAGCGAALEALAQRLEKAYGPAFLLAVLDKEEDILRASGLKERFAHYPGILWLHHPDSSQAIAGLTRWQSAHGALPLLPLVNPFYLRLDRDYYDALGKACAASRAIDFWEKARYAKFKEAQPRILLLTSKYFLIGEISSACERLGLPCRLLQIPDGEVGRSEFIEQLLGAVLEFRPDFVFTINHLGVDREGVLTDLLERLRLPLASWFVDNPHLVLNFYTRLVNPWTALFTWDADNLDSLGDMGFEHVDYLPLGTDATRFTPPNRPGDKPDLSGLYLGLPKGWDRNVAFVGNSMVKKVAENRKRYALPGALTNGLEEMAAGFADDDERSVREFLQAKHPARLCTFDSLPSVEARLGYATLLTWEATRQYRLSCVRGIMPFSPLIAGDEGWHGLLGNGRALPTLWHYHPEMNYYSDLPRFYPCAAINFNCTSKQMKGAVNQRVFDVPATESFLLTDYRKQVENLFEPGTEIVCYHSPEEAEHLTREYLAHPEQRRAVALAARKRILAEHTYEHRVLCLTARMREMYG